MVVLFCFVCRCIAQIISKLSGALFAPYQWVAMTWGKHPSQHPPPSPMPKQNKTKQNHVFMQLEDVLIHCTVWWWPKLLPWCGLCVSENFKCPSETASLEVQVCLLIQRADSSSVSADYSINSRCSSFFCYDIISQSNQFLLLFPQNLVLNYLLLNLVLQLAIVYGAVLIFPFLLH